MVIFRAWGWLVLVLIAACMILGDRICDAAFGYGSYFKNPGAVGVSLVPAAVLCWMIGRRVRNRYIDPMTGRVVGYGEQDSTFFFIPMEWCGVIIGAVSVICCGAQGALLLRWMLG